ncbi:hypothetical protein P3T73_16095 [Kiritimatiellota bacterium B12222]|nr:hypothetical protein P3T73_16095 [Kiritimatiellota bacterium B12222]
MIRKKKTFRIMTVNEHLVWTGLTRNHFPEKIDGANVEIVKVGIKDERTATTDKGPSIAELQPFLIYAACVHHESSPKELTDAQVESATYEYAERARAYASWLWAEVQKSRPQLLLYSQGYELQAFCLRWVAIRCGIPLLAIENTALKDRLLWDVMSGITVNQNLAKNIYWRWKDHLSTAELVPFEARLLATTRGLKSTEHQSPEGKAFKDEQGYVLFLGQVYTDASVVFGLGEWRSPVEVLEALVSDCNAKGVKVFAKLHPKESQGVAPLTQRAYAQLTYRKIQTSSLLRAAIEEGQLLMDQENEYDTYALMEGAVAAVTLTSQAGLEAVMRGVPTILGGEAFYGGLGFTFTCPRPSSMKGALDAVLATSPEECVQMKESALRFAYCFYEKYCVAKSAEGVAAILATAVRTQP